MYWIAGYKPKADNKPTECFKDDYYYARREFRRAVPQAPEHLIALEIGAKSAQCDKLTIDIAWFGCKRPRRILVHSSGLHGIEGFTGSAIQLQWLHNGIPSVPEDCAIAIVHILNPYGMAELRRFNENNVDLNRNFLPVDISYSHLRHLVTSMPGHRAAMTLLNPESAPARDFFYPRAAALVLSYGLNALKAAVGMGQWHLPKGLFYCGSQLEEGPTKFKALMEERLDRVERIVAIDIHTGLGQFGEDRLLVDASAERLAASQTMRVAFGEKVQPLDENGVAFPVRGSQQEMYYRSFPKAETYFAAQEFGTYHPLRIIHALRAENRCHHYGIRGVHRPPNEHLRQVFNPNDAKWRRQVLHRGRAVIQQALTLAFAG